MMPRPSSQHSLPQDAKLRKQIPIGTGVLDYFPDAIAEVAMVSFGGNEQHNPGQALHWAKGKSTDHSDCIPRHFIGRFDKVVVGGVEVHEAAQLAWRALAFLQTLIEEERNVTNKVQT